MDEQIEQLQQRLLDLKSRRAGLLSLLEGITEQVKTTPNKDLAFLDSLVSQLEQATIKSTELGEMITETRLEIAKFRKEFGLD
jgi:chromosome segregation ATPase